VITTIRSAGLSCSHETFCIDGVVGSGSQSNESVSEYRRCCAAFLYCASSFAPEL
jgi:hypothetical protein